MLFKKLIKRWLCVMMVSLTVILCAHILTFEGVGLINPFTVKTQAASIVKSWNYNDVSKLSPSDAQIKATVNLSKSIKISKAGFYIGTSKDNLKKNGKPDTVNKSYKSLPMWYLMSKYGEKLKANTTYYYKFYVIISGKEYQSAVKSFKTKATSSALNVTWSYGDVSKLSANDAQINATVKLSKSTKINQAGFYIGTSKDNLKKNSKPDTVNKAYTSLPMWYLMSKYQGKLNENTTYYYKFYITVNGKEYCSDVKNFKTKASSASVLSWYTDVKSVAEKKAVIEANASTSKTVTVTEGGFYIGTDSENLKKYNQKFSKAYSDTNIPFSFDTSKYLTLTPGTKYFYKVYFVADGKTYFSSLKSFTTKPETNVVKSWDIKSVDKLSQTDAQIKSRVNFTKKVKCTQAGFYFGTSKDNLKKNAKYDSINYTNTYLDMWFLMSKYGQKLKANTTYYYKFYVVADGKTYYSDVKSFKTKTTTTQPSSHEATELFFPLSKKYKWKASTYKGHGKAAPKGAAYSCIDITCVNSSSKGKAVYAVEEGKVINRYDKDGRIVIKHTKKLTTTNGVTFSSYYSVYAHMSGIKVKNGDKVKRGQQIGKVSDKGLGNGAYHLHFQLSSAEKDAKWTSNTSPKLAISPYYVKGFVADYGKQSSHLKFDTGTYCNSRLWNHKPSK